MRRIGEVEPDEVRDRRGRRLRPDCDCEIAAASRAAAWCGTPWASSVASTCDFIRETRIVPSIASPRLEA